MLLVYRHFRHLYGQTRENPGMACFVERTYSPASPLRMISGSIQQMIAQHTKKHPSGKVYMERLNVYGIDVNLAQIGVPNLARGTGFTCIFHSLSLHIPLRKVLVKTFYTALCDRNTA